MHCSTLDSRVRKIQFKICLYMCQLHRHNSFGKNLLHQTAKERKVPRKFDMRQTFCTVSFQFQWILLLSHSCRYHWVSVVGLRHNRNDTEIPCSLIILYAMENPIFKSKMKPNTERLTTLANAFWDEGSKIPRKMR